MVRQDASRPSRDAHLRTPVVLSGGGWASEMPETLSELREYVDKLHFRARIPAHVFAILDVLQSVEHTAALAEARISASFHSLPGAGS